MLKYRALPKPTITLPNDDVAPCAHTPMPTAPPTVSPSSGDMAPRMVSPKPTHLPSGQPTMLETYRHFSR